MPVLAWWFAKTYWYAIGFWDTHTKIVINRLLFTAVILHPFIHSFSFCSCFLYRGKLYTPLTWISFIIKKKESKKAMSKGASTSLCSYRCGNYEISSMLTVKNWHMHKRQWSKGIIKCEASIAEETSHNSGNIWQKWQCNSLKNHINHLPLSNLNQKWAEIWIKML